MDVLSQEAQILKHLRSGKTLTAIEALNRFGCFRLAARVKDLKEEGHDIRSAIVKVDGKRIAKYQMT
jgi:hypothetical protein